MWTIIIIGFILTVILQYYTVRHNLYKLKQRWFAKFMTAISKIYNETTDNVKKELFEPLHEIESADLTLKEQNKIRILEIGCGSGSNFKYYPEGSNLVLVDKNKSFEKALLENLATFPQLNLERLVHTDAESMRSIPDASIDVVVSTCVLCSVNDMKKVLDEIRRVLVPGGKFFFLEHVADKKDTILYVVQCILTDIGLWPAIFCGCHLSRDVGSAVAQAGFSTAEVKHFEFQSDAKFVFKFIKPHVYGSATN